MLAAAMAAAALSFAASGAVSSAPLEFGELSRQCRAGFTSFTLHFHTPGTSSLYWSRRPAYHLALADFERLESYENQPVEDGLFHGVDHAAFAAQYWLANCPAFEHDGTQIESVLEELAATKVGVRSLYDLVKLEKRLMQDLSEAELQSAGAQLEALSAEVSDLMSDNSRPGARDHWVPLHLAQVLLAHRLRFELALKSTDPAQGLGAIGELTDQAETAAAQFPAHADRIRFAFHFEAANAWIDFGEKFGERFLVRDDLEYVHRRYGELFPIPIEQFSQFEMDWHHMSLYLTRFHAVASERATHMSRSPFEVFMSLDLVGALASYAESNRPKGSVEAYCRSRELAQRALGRDLTAPVSCKGYNVVWSPE